MVLFSLKVGEMPQWASCECWLAAVLSVGEETEVNLPWLTLGWRKCDDQRESGKIHLCTATARAPSRGHQADSEAPQGPPQFLRGTS